MATRNSQEDSAQATLQLYNRLLGCRHSSQIAADVLQPLADEVDACSAVYLVYKKIGDRLRVDRGVTIGLDPASLQAYSEHYCQQDPVAHATRQAYPSAAPIISLGKLVERELFVRSDYYNGFLNAFGIDDVMATYVTVPTVDDEVLCVGLHRPKGAPAFGAAERQRLARVQPALSATLTTIGLRRVAEMTGAVMGALDDSLAPIGLAVFDASFGLTHVNQKAARDLALSEPMRSAETIAALRNAARDLTDEAARPITVDFGEDGLCASLTRRRLSDGSVKFLTLTTGAGLRSQMSDRCAQYDLSQRETEVATLLGAGLSNESIAFRLSISVRTVENHLRAIYGKVGVNSRTHLVSRMMGVSIS
jgi:DNA-binding NarL/FixJ family response regulator